MENQDDFLDFTEKHTLTELECELISFFRLFDETTQKALLKVFFEMAIANTLAASSNPTQLQGDKTIRR